MVTVTSTGGAMVSIVRRLSACAWCSEAFKGPQRAHREQLKAVYGDRDFRRGQGDIVVSAAASR